MAFTASVTEFGHTFADAVVEVTEANLEYRLNDYGAGPDGETSSFKFWSKKKDCNRNCISFKAKTIST